MQRGGIRRESIFILIQIFTVFVAPVFASGRLVINEVMINEPGSETSLEWVELLNADQDSLNLKDFIFIEAADTTHFTSRWLKPHTFAVLARKPLATDASAAFERQWGNASNIWGDDSLENYPLLQTKMSLRNSGDSVTIVELSTGATETVKWTSSPPDGVSLERINPSIDSRSKNFKYCKSPALSTPGKTNSVIAKMHDLGFIEDECEIFVPSEPGQPLKFRLAIDNIGQTGGLNCSVEFVEDLNFNGIVDATDTLHQMAFDCPLPGNLLIQDIELLAQSGHQACLFLLPSDDDTTNNLVIFDFVVGHHARELQITEFMCNATNENGCEWIEAQNIVNHEISLRNWRIEVDGKSSVIDSNCLIPPSERLILCQDSVCFRSSFPAATCRLVQPESWHALGNTTGTIVLCTQLEAVSDSVTYRGSIANGLSWERDLDSSGVIFESSFYRSTAPTGSTPCVANSTRPVPVAFDLGFVGGSLALKKDSLQDSLIHVEVEVVNYGYRDVPTVKIIVAADTDRDSLLDEGEALFEEETNPIIAGDSANIHISIVVSSGRHLLIFQLQSDESAANNNICGMITTGPNTGELIVTEFLADPSGNLESEWIEIRNVSTYPIDLHDWSFGDLTHQYSLPIPELLAPGEYRVIAQDAGAFRLFYPEACAPLTCRYWANLNNDGDIIIIRDEFGTLSDSVEFATGSGGNHSLELNELSVIGLPAWYPSVAQSGATPCLPNSRPEAPSASDLGFVPGSLVLSRDSLDNNLAICRIQLVNHAYQNSRQDTIFISHDLNRDGLPQSNELLSQIEVDPIAPGDTSALATNLQLSTGRYYLLLSLPDDEDSDNNLISGCITAGAWTRELVITEFLADPTLNLESEWIELKNVSDYTIDLQGWFCGDLTHQQVVQAHINIAPGEYTVVVQDSAAFTQFYGLDCHIVSSASWSSLNNNGDILVLRDEFGGLADSVSFFKCAGENRSLERNESEVGLTGVWYPSTASSGSTPCSPNSVSGIYSGKISLKLLNRVFAPEAGEQLRFSLQCPPASKFTIEIFDLSGRRRCIIAESQYYSSGEFSYDGASDSASRLPLGAYIMKIESEHGDFSQKVGFAIAPPR